VINTVIPAPVGGRRVINTVIPAPVGVRKVCTMVSLLLPWVGEEERLKTGNPLQRGVVHKEHTFRTHPFHCWWLKEDQYSNTRYTVGAHYSRPSPMILTVRTFRDSHHLWTVWD